MIALAVAVGLAGVGLQAASPPALPRKNFGNCLNKVVHDKMSEKLGPDAFRAAAKAACASEESSFRNAWVTYEVTMKTKRADAEQNANSQIDDYLQNAVETYQDSVTPRT